MSDSQHEKIQKKRDERIAELCGRGLKCERGSWAGWIQFNATTAEKLLKELHRLDKYEL
jgi:hypothetical protein